MGGFTISQSEFEQLKTKAKSYSTTGQMQNQLLRAITIRAENIDLFS